MEAGGDEFSMKRDEFLAYSLECVEEEFSEVRQERFKYHSFGGYAVCLLVLLLSQMLCFARRGKKEDE
jgi:hypothetical protein